MRKESIEATSFDRQMSQVNSYRDLLVWQKAMNLVTAVYSLSSTFPATEIYGLTNQLRRCAISIPSNIAEGYGRNSTADYKRFLKIAVGSLFELQTQIEIALNLRYLSKQAFEPFYEQTRELDRMLLSLIRKI